MGLLQHLSQYEDCWLLRMELLLAQAKVFIWCIIVNDGLIYELPLVKQDGVFVRGLPVWNTNSNPISN
jgi:hypothetical protein